MALPTTREQFKERCLRKLGKPVIEINVDVDQIEDCIDEALQYFRDYHFDGSQKTFLKHQITDTDKTNGYITVPENIISVTNLFDLNSQILSSSNMFDVQYQFVLNNIHELNSGSLTNFFMTMQHLSLMEDILTTQQPIRFNRHVNRLYIDTDWNKLTTGNYIVAEVHAEIDPNEFADVWKDRWLTNYATAKIMEAWGQNLSKFEGMTLPGGVQFNGRQILDDAREQIRRLEDEMISSYSPPISHYYG